MLLDILWYQRLLKLITITMISVEVLTEEKNWSKKIKKEIFLTLFVNLFQKDINL